MSLKDAIREAAGEREKQDNPEIQQDVSLQSSKAVKTASNTALNTSSSKTAQNQSSKAVKTASKKPVAATIETTPTKIEVEVTEPSIEETAALTIRVPLNSRIHWLVSAKKQKTTLTAAITQALNERFGTAPIED